MLRQRCMDSSKYLPLSVQYPEWGSNRDHPAIQGNDHIQKHTSRVTFLKRCNSTCETSFRDLLSLKHAREWSRQHRQGKCAACLVLTLSFLEGLLPAITMAFHRSQHTVPTVTTVFVCSVNKKIERKRVEQIDRLRSATLYHQHLTQEVLLKSSSLKVNSLSFTSIQNARFWSGKLKCNCTSCSLVTCTVWHSSCCKWFHANVHWFV